MSDSYLPVTIGSHQAIRLMALDRAITTKTGSPEDQRDTLELAESYAKFITDGTTP